MKFRPFLGSEDASMKAEVELPSDIESLISHLESTLPYGFDPEEINIIPVTSQDFGRFKGFQIKDAWKVRIGSNVVGWCDSGPTAWDREKVWRAEFEGKVLKKAERPVNFDRKKDGSYLAPWLNWAWNGFLLAKQ